MLSLVSVGDEFQRELGADHLGEALGDGLGGCLVACLHHDADHGLSAGGAQQDAAGVAQFGLRDGHGLLRGLRSCRRGCGPRP